MDGSGGEGWAGLDSAFRRSQAGPARVVWCLGWPHSWEGFPRSLFPSFSVAATVPSWRVGENPQLPSRPWVGVFRPPLLSSKIH